MFNMLTGRRLQRSEQQRPQVVVGVPLLEGTDGKKMSKSAGNHIALDDSPTDMFGKLMSVPDESIATFATLAADMTADEVAELTDGSLRPETAKREVAERVVTIVHDVGAARHARRTFDRVVRDRQLPDDAPEHPLSAEQVRIDRLMVDTGLAASTSEARRLAQQGGAPRR